MPAQRLALGELGGRRRAPNQDTPFTAPSPNDQMGGLCSSPSTASHNCQQKAQLDAKRKPTQTRLVRHQ